MQLSQEWDKTFPKSDKVQHQKVTFKNRYGITLAADLYQPKKRASERLSGLAIGGPFGAVKEQSSGLYAQTWPNEGSSRWLSIHRIPAKAGVSRGMSPHRTSTQRTSAPQWIISVCSGPSTARVSASSAFAAGAAWP
jgi:hypothetical protein